MMICTVRLFVFLPSQQLFITKPLGLQGMHDDMYSTTVCFSSVTAAFFLKQIHTVQFSRYSSIKAADLWLILEYNTLQSSNLNIISMFHACSFSVL